MSAIGKSAARSLAAVTILMFVSASALAQHGHSGGSRSHNSGGHTRSSHRDSATRSHSSQRAGHGDSGRVIRRDRDHVAPRDDDRNHAPSRGHERARGPQREHGAYDRNHTPSRSYDQDAHQRGRNDHGTYDRDHGDRRDYDRSARHADRPHDSGHSSSWRDGRHFSSSGRGNTHRGEPYHARGRVSRIDRHGGGYHVWIMGAHYPFFVPDRYYHHDRFRVGLTLSLGGYYNRGGYYDYYDGSSSGAIRGVVESVDYRRDSFVVRNEATGSFVTVIARDRGLDVRPGDYVEISGEWTRAGAFQAWNVDFLDDGYVR